MHPKEYMVSSNHRKTSATRVSPTLNTKTSQVLILKDAKLQRHPQYIHCQELENNTQALKVDLLHH